MYLIFRHSLILIFDLVRKPFLWRKVGLRVSNKRFLCEAKTIWLSYYFLSSDFLDVAAVWALHQVKVDVIGSELDE